MKKRYELQSKGIGERYKRWIDEEHFSTERKIECAKRWGVLSIFKYRVVQKLGRKVIKVVYPKGK